MNTLSPFHLAIPVSDLQAARIFYSKTLALEEGRSSDEWVDYNFFGHQLVIHHAAITSPQKSKDHSEVDGKYVPVPHFGIVMDWDLWHKFAEELKSKKVKFEIEPHIRFQGKVGEQATMFFYDPSGNALEFKSFKDTSQIFAK